MQAANVIEIHSEISTSTQGSPQALIQYPDIEAIKEWIHNFIEFKAQANQQADCLKETEAWNFLGSNLIIMSDDAEYATQVFTGLCEEAQLDLTKFSENCELAKNCLEALMHPKEQLRVLLIPNPQVLFSDAENSIVQDVIKLMDQSSLLHPLLVVTIASVEKFHKIDTTLRTVGCFDFKIELNAKTHIQYAQSFIDLLPTELQDESLNAHFEKLGKLIATDFAEQRRLQLIALNLVRQAKRNKNKITFKDVVRIASASSTISLPIPIEIAKLKIIAVHESGHATLAMLDSGGTHIPQLLSIKPNANHLAVMVQDYDFKFSIQSWRSYQKLIHEMRILLAGRVATIVYSNMMECPCSGDHGDMERANDIASQFIQRYGLVPPDEVDSNKYSFSTPYYSESSSERTSEMIKKLLNYEFGVVKTLLEQHRTLLDSVYEALMLKKELFQDDLLSIWESYPNKPIKNIQHKQMIAF